MEHEKDLELVTEAYLTQRLYPSRVPLSDGFAASLSKEFKDLKQAGYSFDRILKKITFELRKIDGEKPNEVKLDKMRQDDGPRLPEKAYKEVVKSIDSKGL